MNNPTQFEYEHPTSSAMSGSRVNLTFRWLSQHIKSCPLAGLIGCPLRSDAQGLTEPNSCYSWSEEMEMAMTCSMVLLVVIGACFFWKNGFIMHEGESCRNNQRLSCPECRLFSRSRPRRIGKRRRRSPRRHRNIGISLPYQKKEGETRLFTQLIGLIKILLAIVTFLGPTLCNYFMLDVNTPKFFFEE